MDFTNKIPEDGEVFALAEEENYIRAEFVESVGEVGAPNRIAWRLYDRHGKGILLSQKEMTRLCLLTNNYLKRDDAG